MPPILIVYATREGLTRRVAERVAAAMRAQGREVDVVDAADRSAAAAVDVARCAGAIVAGSVHAGRHEPELVAFAAAHGAALDGVPNAFLSVSMAAADAVHIDEPALRAESQAERDKAVEDFVTATGWRPKVVKPVAGALQYTRYNWLIRFGMRMLAKRKHGPTDTSRDYVFTDWDDLDRFAAGFVAGLSAAP